MPKQKHRRHIIFGFVIAFIIGFFWVMPLVFGPEPAAIIGEGVENIGETIVVLTGLAKVFNVSTAEIVTAIGGLASIIWAAYHIKGKGKQ